MDSALVSAVTPASPSPAPTTSRNSQAASAPDGVSAAVPVAQEKPSAAPVPARDSREMLQAIATQLQDYLSSSQRNVEFRVDADSGTQVIAVRDAVTGDLVRQFPSEEVLAVLRNLNAQSGTLLDRTV